MGLNIGHSEGHRNGVKVIIPSKKGISSLREYSFSIRGPEIFSSLPSELRELNSSMDCFKRKLDDFLELIPDIPRLNYQLKMDSNNLDARIHNWRWNMRM